MDSDSLPILQKPIMIFFFSKLLGIINTAV